MKELFPLQTFHQDAVLKRLSELYENEKDLDGKMPYDEETNTYSINGNVSINGNLDVSGETTFDNDVQVNGSINGEENPSVKPIYCHPVSIIYNSGTLCVACMLIFNNNPTPFTKDSLIQYLKTNTGRWLVNGGYYTSDGTTITYIANSFVRAVNNVLYLYGVDNTGVLHNATLNSIDFGNIISNAFTFEDEVNKIN